MSQKEELVDITVKQASEILKISERAVVYKIQEGSIRGKKVGKKWYIHFSKAQLRAHEKLISEKSVSLPKQLPEKVPKFPEVSEVASVSSGSHRKPDGEAKKKYGDFRELRAYGELQKLYFELVKEKTFDDNLKTLFLLALEKLAIGFYEFEKTRKAQIYCDARGTLARILNRLACPRLTGVWFLCSKNHWCKKYSLKLTVTLWRP